MKRKTRRMAWLLAMCLLAGGCSTPQKPDIPETTASEPAEVWEEGFISTLEQEAAYGDAEGNPLGTILRGALVEYQTEDDGRTAICLNGERVYLLDQEAGIVADPADIIPAHTLYVRTAVNLRDADGRLLPAFAEKGAAVEVTGYDRLIEDGGVHMYQVKFGDEEGYIAPWYLSDQVPDTAVDAVHAGRGDRYGGGGAAELDYHPREKGPIPGNEMPDECRTLYIVSWRLDEVDA